MIRYILTTHRRLPGVALARAGQWGGRRFQSASAAEDAARADAKGEPHFFDRETFQ